MYENTIVVTTLSLGSQPRQGHGKVRVESVIRESHSHSRELKNCEGMSPHTPKWTPTLGVGVLIEYQIFREQF